MELTKPFTQRLKSTIFSFAIIITGLSLQSCETLLEALYVVAEEYSNAQSSTSTTSTSYSNQSTGTNNQNIWQTDPELRRISASLDRWSAQNDPPALRALHLRCSKGDMKACQQEIAWRKRAGAAAGYTTQMINTRYGSSWANSFNP